MSISLFLCGLICFVVPLLLYTWIYPAPTPMDASSTWDITTTDVLLFYSLLVSVYWFCVGIVGGWITGILEAHRRVKFYKPVWKHIFLAGMCGTALGIVVCLLLYVLLPETMVYLPLPGIMIFYAPILGLQLAIRD